jgi:hypothetical protein
MARSRSRRPLKSPPGIATLDAEPRSLEAVRRLALALLRWQKDLARFPALGVALPDGTPFVTLYHRGELRGCVGSNEGTPAERLARAAVAAAHDARYPLRASEREDLVLQVSYPMRPRAVSVDQAARALEVGTHGTILAGPATTVLLPDVARDEEIDAAAMLGTLARKAGADLEAGKLYLFETCRVVVGRKRETTADEPLKLARRWLARQLSDDGEVRFSIDARRRKLHPRGYFHHGRSAIVLAALGNGKRTTRARERLCREIRAGLAGKPVVAFPEGAAEIAGTLALAVLSGLPLRRELLALAADADLRRSPWHAAQVAAALGPEAPDALYAACVTPQDWAPWTALAAHARGDGRNYARNARALIASLATKGPHAGGANVTDPPELALTALTIEALAHASGAAAEQARARGRRFLLRHQLAGEGIPAALDPELCRGAFPISPSLPVARADVTAHALRALSPAS